MSVRVIAMTTGWLTGAAGGFLEGADGQITVPIPSYLIRHPRGDLVFDTGMHADLQRSTERLGPIAEFFTVRYHPNEELPARLRELGVDPDRLELAVVSHLHFDHVGGLAHLPNARMLLQRREWEAGRDADLAAANTYVTADYDTGHDVVQVDGEHDVFGDGSVTCIPTYGHTPGHQSLQVHTPGGPVVLTADACYLRRTLEELRLSPYAYDREASLEALHRLRALRDAGARLYYGHEPADWPNGDGEPREITPGAA